jgi:hypothetical protein
MKSKFTALIYLSLIFTCSIFSQDSWKFFSTEMDEGLETFYYYDTASLSKTESEQFLNVKVDYVPDRFDKRTEKYIDYIIENIEVNCRMNNYKIGDLTLFYNDKSSEKVLDNKTLAIIAKVHADKLFNMLCGQRDKFWDCAKMYFAKSYTTLETTTSDRFSLQDNPNGITIIVDLRFCDSAIGITKVEFRISQLDEMLQETLVSSDIADNIKPDWRFIHFDDIEFPRTGLYKASLIKPDGTVLIYGYVIMN